MVRQRNVVTAGFGFEGGVVTAVDDGQTIIVKLPRREALTGREAGSMSNALRDASAWCDRRRAKSA